MPARQATGVVFLSGSVSPDRTGGAGRGESLPIEMALTRQDAGLASRRTSYPHHAIELQSNDRLRRARHLKARVGVPALAGLLLGLPALNRLKAGLQHGWNDGVEQILRDLASDINRLEQQSSQDWDDPSNLESVP